MSDPDPAPAAPAAPRIRSWLRYLPIVLVAALFIAVIASGQLRRLSLGDLMAHREALAAFVAGHPAESLAVYVGIFTLVLIACVPGPSVMSVAGGFLFGPLLGGAAALASMLAGSTVVFLACRTAAGDWAARRAGPLISRLEAGFARDAFSYVLALRLMPIAPVFMVNLACGIARVPVRSFVLATLIGSAPSAFIFAGLGAGLGGLMHRHVHADMRLLARPAIALPLIGLALLSLTPVAWRLWQRQQARP